MDARERQTIDLLGMLVSLRAGWLYLLTVPAVAALCVFVAFELFPVPYMATARFVVPSSTYMQLRSLDFQRQVAARVSELGGESGSDGLADVPVLSPLNDDGSTAVSYPSDSEAGARLYVQTFADMAHELVAGAPRTNGDTVANINLQIEIDGYDAYIRRTNEALYTMLDRLKNGYGSGPFQSAVSDDMGSYMTAYKVYLDSVLTSSIHVETQRARLAQSRAELRTEIGRTEVSVASTARYRLVPVMLSVLFAALLLTAAVLIARTSLLRAAHH